MAAPLNVDANKVIAVLRERLSEMTLQNAILEVAVTEAQVSNATLAGALQAMQEANKEAPKPEEGENDVGRDASDS